MKRITRSRKRGWKMPDNTVYVGRPTKWGNPFKLVDGTIFYFCVNRTILNPWIIYDHVKDDYTLEDLLYFYDLWIRGLLTKDIGLPDPPVEILTKMLLQNKDLACWCPLDQPCHVDVLIKLFNEPETEN